MSFRPRPLSYGSFVDLQRGFYQIDTASREYLASISLCGTTWKVHIVADEASPLLILLVLTMCCPGSCHFSAPAVNVSWRHRPTNRLGIQASL